MAQKLLYLILLSFIPTYSTAQHLNNRNTTIITNESTGIQEIFVYVERMPEAGYDINKYLSENIVYPKEALSENISGKVYVRFVVNTNGSISDVKTIKSLHPLLDEEAIRVILNMPKWKPAIQNGHAVRSYYTLPVSFTPN